MREHRRARKARQFHRNAPTLKAAEARSAPWRDRGRLQDAAASKTMRTATGEEEGEIEGAGAGAVTAMLEQEAGPIGRRWPLDQAAGLFVGHGANMGCARTRARLRQPR
jgi:hypothetical protein